MKFIWCIVICLVAKSKSFENSDLGNVLSLTSNFFDNLNSLGESVDDETKNLIDSQIDYYVNLVKKTHGLLPRTKTRRSIFNDDINILSEDFIGVYILNGFFEQNRIPVINPIDMTLFKHDFGSTEVWYAAVLQNNNIKSKEANRFFIFRLENDNFVQISNISVSKGTKISTHTSHGIIYLSIAENSLKSKVLIFQFDIHENLNKIQTIDAVNPSDLTIWEYNNIIYLAVAQEKYFNLNYTYYETPSLIFKWSGDKFDLAQNIVTNGARKITPFLIGDEQYLAVANHINNREETEIFSEIFKFDTQSQRYLSYQQILTHAAMDIKYFCFTQNSLQENFIVFGNSYELDYDNKINYTTNSIIYKFVEGYFMPFQSITLNYAEKWLPVAGLNGEFMLLASLKYEGIKIFQYDGWRFVQSDVQFTGEAFGPGVRNFGSFLYESQPIIVVANENDRGDLLNIFSPTFNYQNIMNEFQMDILDWCQRITKEINNDELKELNRQVEEAPKIDDLEIEVHGKLSFQNVTIYNLVVDDENLNKRFKKSAEFSNFEKEIDEKSEQLKQIESDLKNNPPIVLNGNVRVKNLEISDDRITFEDLHVDKINNIPLNDFLNDIINIDEEFTLTDDMHFEDIIFDGFISPNFINNIPKNALIHKQSNLSVNNNLIVHGNVIVDDLFVNGYFNGIKIDENNILLTEGDQNLLGTLRFSEITTENLNISYLNNIDMINLDSNKILDITEHSIENLTVKNVTIDKINGMNMDIFSDLVLRTRGDQEIISDYEFETLIVDEIIVDGPISNTNLSDLALISGTTNLILQPIYFTQDLETSHLHVINSLNRIPVHNGKMDVLLKNCSKMQHIEAKKTFENINLSGPIELRGRIDIKGFDSPIISKNVTLTGDYTITGETVITKLLKFNDLTNLEGVYSMERLAKQGLKLSDTEIPVHLNFDQNLNIDELEVDTINDIDVNSWIVFEDDIPKITGTKIFEGDLHIYGKLNVTEINGENLEQLYNNILRIDSDQIITGEHVYSNVSSIRVVSNKTSLNDILWENFLTIDGEQFIDGTTIFPEAVKLNQFEANSAKIKNLKDINFDDMIADTAFNDTKNIVTGSKYFENKVVFENIQVDFINNASLNKFLSEINEWLGDVHLDKSIIMDYLKIENLFCEELNGIKKADFGNLWLTKGGTHTVYEDQHFEELRCNNLEIISDYINNISLAELDSEAVKTYEDHKFDFIEFENGMESAKNIEIGGKINNIDINDAVLTEGLENQIISGLKTISNNLTVDGRLQVDGLLSGINLTLLEKLTKQEDTKNIKLVIDGNINFEHNFNTKYLNNIDIEKLSKNVWYTDKPVEIKGNIFFENVVFEDELKVDGLVNGIPITWLSKNYFSKTKDQNISAHLAFVDGVVFAKDIEAKKADVKGLVANIKIQDFTQHILTHGDQIFNYEMKFDSVEVINEFDAKLINNFNLATDVMRNDVPENYVTGTKIIRNLNALTLDIAKGKKIQNVDVDDWFQNAVTLNGSFKIEGVTTIKNAKFEKNIDLQGLLNSHNFTENHVVLTNKKQKITGKKTFITSGPLFNSTLKFNNLELKGLYNNISIETLLETQIDKSKKVVEISGPKIFHNTVSASDVIINNYRGVDINKLIKNITDLENLKNYAEEYEKLTEYAKNVLVVLDQQSHYLDTYKQIQKLKINVQNILVSQDYENSFTALVTQNKKSVKVLLYEWDTKTNNFTQIGDIPIDTKNEITFCSKISFNNKIYLYLEEKSNENTGLSHLATMYEISTSKTEINLLYSNTNKTIFVTSFSKPNNTDCLLNIQNDNIANIFCNNDEYIFELEQQIDIANGAKASTIQIENIPYIFITNIGENLLDSTLQILKYDVKNFSFNWHQILGISEPSSLDSIYYERNYYLAVALKHNIESGNPGEIIIYKYQNKDDKFKKWQEIKIIDPVEIKFSIISSNELILEALSNCPAEPLVVYLYRGASGFMKKFTTSALPTVSSVTNFIADNIDFILVSNEKEVTIFEASYKGKYVTKTTKNHTSYN